MKKLWSIAALAALLVCRSGAQTAPAATATSSPQTATESGTAAPSSAKIIEVPAGTKVLLVLISGVNTKTAVAGDGVYLTSSFPVIAQGRVVIPSGAYVQGVIDKVVRPGRVSGRAEVSMHFTTLIFPNGYVVDIPGTVNSLPGSGGPSVKGSEGAIQEPGSKGKDAKNIATGTVAGAGIGGIAGEGHPGASAGYGALAGGVGGVIYTLFTRGNDLTLEAGRTVEIVFQRPLLLEEASLKAPAAPGFVPAPGQPQPMPKPVPHPQ
jgi:hypothetical protein